METAIQSRFRRTIRLLLYLQSGPRFNAAQLAKEFQVSRRTVFRDMNFLRDMGLPVRFDEEHGGFSLAGEIDIAKEAHVTTDEWFVLLLAAHLSMAAVVPDVAASVRQATAKLLGTLVADDRQRLCQVLNACSLDLPTTRTCECHHHGDPAAASGPTGARQLSPLGDHHHQSLSLSAGRLEQSMVAGGAIFIPSQDLFVRRGGHPQHRNHRRHLHRPPRLSQSSVGFARIAGGPVACGRSHYMNGCATRHTSRSFPVQSI